MAITRYGELNGKSITYNGDTLFMVQVGRPKYETKYCIMGNLDKAVLWYKGINVGYGYRKRLLLLGNPMKKPTVLAKQFSH